jgi:biopolymer transport protein ExbD
MVLMPAGAANVQQVTDIMDALQGAGAQSITLERDVFDIDLADF